MVCKGVTLGRMAILKALSCFDGFVLKRQIIQQEMMLFNNASLVILPHQQLYSDISKFRKKVSA